MKIKTVEELKGALEVVMNSNSETEQSVLAGLFAKVLNKATKDVIKDFVIAERFDQEENTLHYITCSNIYYKKTTKAAIIEVLSWRLSLRVTRARKQTTDQVSCDVVNSTMKLIDYRGLLNFSNPFLEDNKKINEIITANFDLIENCASEDEIYNVCINSAYSFLRYLCSQEIFGFDTSANYAHDELARMYARKQIALRVHEKKTASTKTEQNAVSNLTHSPKKSYTTEQAIEALKEAVSHDERLAILGSLGINQLKKIGAVEQIAKFTGNWDTQELAVKILSRIESRYAMIDAGKTIRTTGLFGMGFEVKTPLINARKAKRISGEKLDVIDMEAIKARYEADCKKKSEPVKVNTSAIKDLTELFDLVSKIEQVEAISDSSQFFAADEELRQKYYFDADDEGKKFYFTARYLAYVCKQSTEEARRDVMRKYGKAGDLRGYINVLMSKFGNPTNKAGYIEVILEVSRRYDAYKAAQATVNEKEDINPEKEMITFTASRESWDYIETKTWTDTQKQEILALHKEIENTAPASYFTNDECTIQSYLWQRANEQAFSYFESLLRLQAFLRDFDIDFPVKYGTLYTRNIMFVVIDDVNKFICRELNIPERIQRATGQRLKC